MSLRIIAEYNDFQKKLFVQPLLQWNPNPSTIFYIGGNQNALREEIGNNFGPLYLDNSQMFIKFQYLISLWRIEENFLRMLDRQHYLQV